MKDNSVEKSKNPWPTKAVMQQVYKEKLWGDNGAEFFSGEGSHHPKLVQPYIQTVTRFLNSFEEPLSVCDLGCGDFNIGRQLVPHVKKYIAVDIVKELIQFNSRKIVHPKVEFQCLDIAKDRLPKGDCAILRQVLQHLSNDEVKRVVDKLYDFKYVLLTEHLPQGPFVPNFDIISGQGIRLKKRSGLDVLQPPFNLKVKERKPLLAQSALTYKGQIVTSMYRMF